MILYSTKSKSKGERLNLEKRPCPVPDVPREGLIRRMSKRG